MEKKKHFNCLKESFGIDVFNEKAMREYLPREVVEELLDVVKNGRELKIELANQVAAGLKEWALNKGATHYSHWFQPLNGLTAEKHDSFLMIDDLTGEAIFEFSGRELIKGEPDASSFPNGGLRATFEARGYTMWDASSPAFIASNDGGKCLYIPTAFCSYHGDALDEKTPLLRSEAYLSEQALRVLQIFGDQDSKRVNLLIGPEQEYFLIEAEQLKKRKDIIYSGRTLFGAPSPKGQELDDHYFAAIRGKVAAYMDEVNQILWRLGIPAKTEHNEVAPSQHELAVIYAKANIAADQNQMVMRVLQRTAKKHGLICLLKEKPFAGVNGSGKHINFSLATDRGVNLFTPGQHVQENKQFLVFLAALLKACDEFAPLLRESVSSYNNDLRLGGHEAPPSVLSVFIGEALNSVVEEIINEKKALDALPSFLLTGTSVLPSLRKDNTDRNRTSPFAFTGNRFEFRMVGSALNISTPAMCIATALGYELKCFADYVDTQDDKKKAIDSWIKETLTAHSRIIFNGNGYADEWLLEAQKRGLPCIKDTYEAIDNVEKDQKIHSLFSVSGVLSNNELSSRLNIRYLSYANDGLIEAKAASHMVHKLFLPALHRAFAAFAKEKHHAKDTQFVPRHLDLSLSKISELIDETYEKLEILDADIARAKDLCGKELAFFVHDSIKFHLEEVRKPIDEAELLLMKDEWPIPSYGDLLFHVI